MLKDLEYGEKAKTGGIMLTKAYFAFFKGDHRMAQRGLKRLKELKVDIRDVKCLFKRKCGPRGTEIMMIIKGVTKDTTWTLLYEQTDDRR